MSGKKSPEDKASPNFESALEELQAIVAKMEDGKLALEESLVAYQRGVELLKLCEARLADERRRDEKKDQQVENEVEHRREVDAGRVFGVSVTVHPHVSTPACRRRARS